MRIILFILVLSACLTKCCQASVADDQTQILGRFGVGVGVTGSNSHSEVKIGSIAYTAPLLYLFRSKAELGVWTDANSEDAGRTGSYFGSYSIGMRIEPSILYAEYYLGLAGITKTDAYLSTHYQFSQDLGIGLKDNIGRFIGLNYKHLSNAGIKHPNKGRDFVALTVGIGF